MASLANRIFRRLFFSNHGTNAETRKRYPCSQGDIVLFYKIPDWYDVSAFADESDEEMEARGPAVLTQLTDRVQIEVRPKDKSERPFRTWFSVQDCTALFAGSWPNSQSYARIAWAVRERQNYPLTEPEIPGGGGKSMTAQGQTKKPGSHSHDRHR